jgi:hypothetical protein
MVDVTNVQERFDGLMAKFMICGVIVGKNAGKMPAQRRGAPDTAFCKLTFMLPTPSGAPRSTDVSVPGDMDHEQYQVGQYVEMPITVNFFEGRLTFRAIDTNAAARAVGQAARDPARTGTNGRGSRPDMAAMSGGASTSGSPKSAS